MSVAFDGRNTTLVIPSGTWGVLDTEKGYSISIWGRVSGDNGVSQQQWLFHRSGAALGDANTCSIRITESSNAVTALDRDSANSLGVNITYSSTGEWSNSGWFNMIVTRSRPYAGNITLGRSDDTSYSKLYINGHLASSDSRTGALTTNINPICIGKIGNTQSLRTFSGDLAEFAIWDRVLSEGEISQIWRGHDPQFLEPVLYFPLRNDYVDRINNITGIGITNARLILDHPPQVKVKGYYPLEEAVTVIPELITRLGTLEQRGLLDFVDWIPGSIVASGYSQTGAFFGEARVGEGYQIYPNRSISGCITHVYASNSGTLTMTVYNPTSTQVNLTDVVRWNVFRW